MSKPALNLQYRKVERGENSNKNVAVNNKTDARPKQAEKNAISTQNTFGALSNDNDDDEQVDEYMGFDDRQNQNSNQGASTPLNTVLND